MSQKVKFVIDWDVPRPNPLSTLIRAHLELEKCQKKLKNQVKESEPVRKEINDLWKELKKKQDFLQSVHLEFDKLKSVEKKTRAKEKLEEEVKLQAKLESQLKNVKAEVQQLAAIKEKMEKYLKKYKIFEEYLNYVVEHNEEFSSVDDILDRYRTLCNMQSQLENTVESDLQFMIESRNDIDDLTEDKFNTINILNNRLAKIRVKAKETNENLMYWDTLVTTIKTFIAEKTLEIEMVRDATWSLYVQMSCRHKPHNVVPKNNFEKQISFIYKTIMQYKQIVQIATKKSSERFQSHCPNSSALSVKKE